MTLHIRTKNSTVVLGTLIKVNKKDLIRYVKQFDKVWIRA